jgi:hypothetical protein
MALPLLGTSVMNDISDHTDGIALPGVLSSLWIFQCALTSL